MLRRPYNYKLYFDFIESNLSAGFLNINSESPIMQKLEELTKENDQFFSLRDMSQIKYLFTSKGSEKLFGVKPNAINSSFFRDAVHPDDSERLGRGKTHMIRVTKEIYEAKGGTALMSYTLRFRNAKGAYKKFLGQSYFFYTEIPRKAVYMIQVATNVNWCKKVNSDGHYYTGNDLSLFKFPDDNLLQIGSVLTKREREIIELIASGLSSKEIAQKIFRSVATVDKHRYNIIQKTGMTTSETVIDLLNKGLL